MAYTTETHCLAILETRFQGQGVGRVNSLQGWEEESSTCESLLGFTVIFIVLGLETHCPTPASVFTRHSPLSDDCAQIPLFLWGYQPCWIRASPTPVGPHLNSSLWNTDGHICTGATKGTNLLTSLKTVHTFNDAMAELLTYISLWLALSFCFVSCFILKQSLLEPRLVPNSLPSPNDLELLLSLLPRTPVQTLLSNLFLQTNE